MVQTSSPLGFDCALKRYLEKISSEEGGKAEFAAAMLADLGFFEMHQSRPNVSNLDALLEVFATNGGREMLNEMSGLCKACRNSSGCPVGDLILARQVDPSVDGGSG